MTTRKKLVKKKKKKPCNVPSWHPILPPTPIQVATQTSMCLTAKEQSDVSRESLVGVVDLDALDASADSSLDILLEACLGTGVGLRDGVAELVNVLGHTEVCGVVLPVAIEDVLEVQTRTIE
jgi:hypothetical protein